VKSRGRGAVFAVWLDCPAPRSAAVPAPTTLLNTTAMRRAWIARVWTMMARIIRALCSARHLPWLVA